MEKEMNKELTYKDVWETLSKIDVSDKVEKKMNLSYLSWAWAWGTMMDNYPDAQYNFYENQETGVPYVTLPDGTAEVRCRVTIGNLAREMWLPVMDFKNNAVANPSAREVSDTKMRCLVKTLGMWGLGLYIYAGQDLPSTDKQETKSKKAVVKEDANEQEGKLIYSGAVSSDESKPVEKDKHDENWANLFLDGIQVPLKLCKDVDGLNDVFVKNKPSIDIIESRHKDIFEKIVELFKTKKEELK
tara:strand:- start:11377 stop:12108 length:732 start_codon:yes stop_codon:yes gene_type:complete